METKFKCAWCGKDFQRKSWYDKHTCEQKKRFLQSHNMDVILAGKLYDHWCKRRGYVTRQGYDIKKFLRSPFYNTFIKLVEHSHKNYLISPYIYLDWIIDHDIPEKKWFNESSLSSYRTYMRKNDDPAKHVEISVRNAMKWCTENEAPLAQFFSRITPGQALAMILTNQLMPWVVFGYDHAVATLLSRFDDEKLEALKEKVNVDHWIDKVAKRPDDVRLVSELCANSFGA